MLYSVMQQITWSPDDVALRSLLILGVCILLRLWDPGDRGFLFRLRNVTIVGKFYY
jgi:hypothetical protein